ncbi:MAG: M4 family metallopeptidase [Terrimesophilobacter sp.]
MRFAIVPPYLLLRIARLDDPRFAAAAEAARRAVVEDLPFRTHREQVVDGPPVVPAPGATIHRIVSDAQNVQTVPGTRVRGEGEVAVADVAVNEAYDGLGCTYKLYHDVYGRASIDGKNMPLLATVHYGKDYDNAFWDSRQLVFGDGDGQIFNRFTASLSVIGHELTHGVTQYTANLVYRGQSGALNESVSDVFGALVEQYAHQESAEEASWLIGDGLFTDEVEGTALRSMKRPGTAYDDDVLGKDPQPATMAGYVETDDDNGGVHLNSGIPNHAFYLVATAIGGVAWEKAGRIWYNTLTAGTLAATSDFRQFAMATLSTATQCYGADSAEHRAVADAWDAVGVTR